MKRTAGFSLLELMVVVAIIGVLAAVAVPRFNIFRARARQAEAKSNLGVIFTLQEAFKIDKEEYYNGDGTGTQGWGGSDMNSKRINDEKYVGYGSPSKNGCDNVNRLGFRLANCDAARYMYWIAGASEQVFLAVAWGASDHEDKRIFPGCKGTKGSSTVGLVEKPSDSKSLKKCDTSGLPNETQATFGDARGGDGFCLDQNRTVDNYRDIVAAGECTE